MCSMIKRSFFCTLLAIFLAVAMQAGDVPRKAPSLELKTTSGKSVSLSSLKGKVVAVLWISTDCPHCQHACELMAPLYKELSAQGLEILALAVNVNAPGNIAEFKTRHKVSFDLGVSTRSHWLRFADLSLMARVYVPYMMIVDRNGIIRYEHSGQDQEFWDNQEVMMRTEFTELLAERQDATH